MDLYEDLIEQAEALATKDRRKPKQANLRRAVSSMYYALFHFLVDQTCQIMLGSSNSQTPYRHVLGRAFVHTVMKQACTSFGGGTLKDSVIKGLPRNKSGNYVIPPEIQKIASLFTEIQDWRHLADYDLSEKFIRSDVLTLIEQSKHHMSQFSSSKNSDEKRFFLVCLLAWKEISGR
ncbi:MAG: hypothetical protein NUW37_17445 [Planctomycetes bacterium]|nr:hypothetical protein [Planctomycetota bacterium]